MTKTNIILKKLRHSVLSTSELIEGFIPSYQGTYKALRRKIYGSTSPQKLTKYEKERLQEKCFFTLLSRLKHQGFIEKQKLGHVSRWRITQKGIQKIKNGAKILKTSLFPKRLYPLSEESELIIVLFDIPEKLKLKRMWIRNNLKKMEFKMLQKSAWIGKSKIPEEFIFDLEQMEILKYVHILKVEKKGSLINWEL